jgi:hypothetical protein
LGLRCLCMQGQSLEAERGFHQSFVGRGLSSNESKSKDTALLLWSWSKNKRRRHAAANEDNQGGRLLIART